MSLDLASKNRILIEADLIPAQGERFQPTGFADLGAAVYTLPDGTRKLLVESAQSMANRLEATVTTPEGMCVPELEGISYVIARLQGSDVDGSVVSTLTEPHRLASPFIISDKRFQDAICSESGYNPKGKLDWKRIYRTIFKYDVNSLLHGVFLSTVEGGRIKVPRLISSFIEATNIREAVSGGVKNSFDPTGKIQHVDCSKDVYSNVPYQRVEYTAEKITVFFNIDVAGIKALGLPTEAQELLLCLALYKVCVLLDGGLRLRTACDLMISSDIRLEGMGSLPEAARLLDSLQSAIRACKPLFADPAVTELTAPVIQKA
jgi:CRISPR-associated protein Csb1